MKKVEERFLEYVVMDTKSDESTRVTPSTKGQLVLGEKLVQELKEIGLSDVHVDEFGYVYATLPKNTDKKIPTIGFIAHMDTAPDMSGKDVKPQIVKNYQGQDIVLNEELNVHLAVSSSPELKNYIGKTLITTDGTTLLGADDKAGIAEIMTAMEFLINNPEIKHGDIKVGFTPDEEIGEGSDHFNVKEFNAEFAYTMDGGHVGELEYENFNACTVKVSITGRNVHPGYAKNKMINSIMVSHEFMSMLPLEEVPEKTEDYEGFIHVMNVEGCIEKANLIVIIREFFEDKYKAKQELFRSIEEKLNAKYGKGTIVIEIIESYKNMKEMVEPVIHVVESAKKAMEMADIVSHIRPIRGGTDGARLSFMGLPCPNIFAGGENFHGRHEFVAVESMEKAVETIVNIVKIYGEK
ncbi:peptidase T [uncultured Clostridium sp.]|uniref:peptidase T n=1 Tax=uncultured Clostridium sp. TaxID=59620 RepID=UPI0026137A54|nr:peptidase T [uncultured Clostridium sp.]